MSYTSSMIDRVPRGMGVAFAVPTLQRSAVHRNVNLNLDILLRPNGLRHDGTPIRRYDGTVARLTPYNPMSFSIENLTALGAGDLAMRDI